MSDKLCHSEIIEALYRPADDTEKAIAVKKILANAPDLSIFDEESLRKLADANQIVPFILALFAGLIV